MVFKGLHGRNVRNFWSRSTSMLKGGHYEGSDGNHNHRRLGAEIECVHGHCGYCITTMERLLRNKRIGVPSAP